MKNPNKDGKGCDPQSLSDSEFVNDKELMRKTSLNISSMTDIQLDLDLDKKPKGYEKYDPSLDEQICCIELVNNNKVYIRYENEWTIRDLIKALVKHRDFRKLYPTKEFQLDSENYLSIFDLHLILYRSIKEEIDTKIDFNIKLSELQSLGLLKNYKYPFFYFKDNRNLNNKIRIDSDTLNEMTETGEYFLQYKHYLPRANSILILKRFPEYEHYFNLNKRGVNQLNRIFMDPLISENENLDWFIYDDESLNFLIDMEGEEFTTEEKVEYATLNHPNEGEISSQVYFQDKYPYVILSNREYKNICVAFNLNDTAMKVEASLMSTFSDLLKKINDKLKKIRPQMCFDLDSKILKVHSLNDYVLDNNEPIGKFAYINDSIKNNKIPEYWILDNPLKAMETCKNDNSFLFQQMDSNLNNLNLKNSNLNSNLVKNKRNTFLNQDEVTSRIDLFSCLSTGRDLTVSNSTAMLMKKNSIGINKIRQEDLMKNLVEGMNRKDKVPIINPFSNPKDQSPEKYNFKKQYNIAAFNPNDKDVQIFGSSHFKTSAESGAISSRISKLASKFEGGVRNSTLSMSQYEERKSSTGNKFSITSTSTGYYIDPVIELLSCINEGKIKNLKEELVRLEKSQEKEEDRNEDEFCEEINKDLLLNRKRSKGIEIKITRQGIDIDSTDLPEGTKIIKNYKNSVIMPNSNSNTPDKNNSGQNKNILSSESKSESKMNDKCNPVTVSSKDINKMIQEINEPIFIQKLPRPFSLLLNNLELKDRIYNSAFDPKKENFTVLMIKVQIFCGSESFTDPRFEKWKGYKDQNPLLNKKIYFDIQYRKLPMEASIVFKVKLLQYNKQYKLAKHETVAWANFRLFDHNRRLKTGLHKLSLWETPFSDDSYFCWIDNPNPNLSSPQINFEIESFVSPVVHQIEKSAPISYNHYSYMISETDQMKFSEISEKSPFDELNNYDKEVLWSNRYAITKLPSIIPKFLLCVDKKNEYHLKEMDKILKLAENLKPVGAMELLTGKFLNETIRKFAVKCLQEASYIEVQDYIIQLVQALKYEMYHDSNLARYILRLAIKYPLTLGHCLFWNLRSEMYNPIVQQRFGLYLEIFLNHIGKNLRQIFEDESLMIKALLNVADIPHDKSLKSEEEKLRKFRTCLTQLNEELFKNGKEISMPLNFKMRVKKFVVEKCRFMKSKKKPLWLVFENADPKGENIVVMFKKGDDLRQDILTLQLFKIMNTLWFEEKINLKMSLYNVVCTGYFQGMLEIVQDSETLATVHKLGGGATASMTAKPLKKWLEKNANVNEKEYVSNFLVSSVAYCVATFVLGIGDRHNDNIMIKKNGELFHIDFGHFLGHFKKKYGFKRERAPFVFTKEFRKVLGGKKGKDFKTFKELTWNCYKVLRNNADTLVTLLRIMVCCGIPELFEKSIRFLETSLAMNLDRDQADKFLQEKLDESLSSYATRLNFAIHVIANK